MYSNIGNNYRGRERGNGMTMKELLQTPEIRRKWEDCMYNYAGIRCGLPSGIFTGLMMYGLCYATPMKQYAKHLAFVSSGIGYLLGKSTCGLYCLQSAVGARLIKVEPAAGEMYLTFEPPPQQLRQAPELPQQESQESVLDLQDSLQFNDTYNSIDMHSINGVDEYLSVDAGSAEPSDTQKNITYDELRQKHREQYQQREPYHQQMYGRRTEPPPVQKKVSPPAEPTPMIRRNKYGDIME